MTTSDHIARSEGLAPVALLRDRLDRAAAHPEPRLSALYLTKLALRDAAAHVFLSEARILGLRVEVGT